MLNFQVDRFEKLDDRPVKEALNGLRRIEGNRLMDREAYWDSRSWNQGEAEDED